MGVGRKATPYILWRVTVMARDMVCLPTGGLALRGTPVYQRCPPFVRWVVVGAAAALARPQTPAWPRLGPAGPPGPAGGFGASVGRASGLSALLGPPSFPWRWSNSVPGRGWWARPVAAPPRPGGRGRPSLCLAFMAPLRSGVAAVRPSWGRSVAEAGPSCFRGIRFHARRAAAPSRSPAPVQAGPFKPRFFDTLTGDTPWGVSPVLLGRHLTRPQTAR